MFIHNIMDGGRFEEKIRSRVETVHFIHNGSLRESAHLPGKGRRGERKVIPRAGATSKWRARQPGSTADVEQKQIANTSTVPRHFSLLFSASAMCLDEFVLSMRKE